MLKKYQKGTAQPVSSWIADYVWEPDNTDLMVFRFSSKRGGHERVLR
jgi:hypothetical protein